MQERVNFSVVILASLVAMEKSAKPHSNQPYCRSGKSGPCGNVRFSHETSSEE